MSAAVPARRRQRIDRLLVERGLAPSREKAQALILAGLVNAAGRRIDKSGTLIPGDAPIAVAATARFVGRGGEKLDGALEALGVKVRGIAALDVGASTGGFTDCLLQRGAGRVVALDVGRGQLDWRLRQDARVVVVEGVNVRYLEPGLLPAPFDLVVVDVSFIPLRLVLPNLVPLLRRHGTGPASTPAEAPSSHDGRTPHAVPGKKDQGGARDAGDEPPASGRAETAALPAILALVKPQFEVGRGAIGRGGIVRIPERQLGAVLEVAEFARSLALGARAIVESSLRGAEGNREFFIHFLPGYERSREEVEAEARRAVLGTREDG